LGDNKKHWVGVDDLFAEFGLTGRKRPSRKRVHKIVQSDFWHKTEFKLFQDGYTPAETKEFVKGIMERDYDMPHRLPCRCRPETRCMVHQMLDGLKKYGSEDGKG